MSGPVVSPAFRKMFTASHGGNVIIPLLVAHLNDPNFKKFKVQVEGVQTRDGDGWFHPSTHPLWGERQLYYYLTNPPGLIQERLDITSTLAITAGHFWHTMLQKCLIDLKVLSASEVPVVDEEAGSRGHMDGAMVRGEAFELKALDCATPILTRDGWSTMGSLVDGDEVYAPDGQLTKVIGAHPIRYGRPCYRLDFRDGQSVVADAEHLWEVEEVSAGCRKQTRTLTTQQLVDSGVRGRNRFRFSVPVTGALQREDVALPIDPWVLGAWLGDGHSSEPSLTVGAVDLDYVLSRLDQAGVKYRITEDKRTNGWVNRVYMYDLRGHMVRLGVLNDKHIPDSYMLASESQRRSLLAGLMDTDGTMGPHQASIGMVKPVLMRQVLQLVRSLGYRATLRNGMAKLNGRETSELFTVKFSAGYPISPFGMPRKSDLFGSAFKSGRTLRNAITSIEPVESRPTRCITVAHESSLYAVGEGFVPTHNTMNGFTLPKITDMHVLKDKKPEYYAQAQEYMRMSGYDMMRMLIVGPDYPYPMKEIVIPYDRVAAMAVRDKYLRVRQAVADQVLPEACCGIRSTTAKQCFAREVCPVGLVS